MTGAPGTGVAPAERLARAALTRVAEPPLGSLIRLVERVGAEQAWAEVRSGRADLPDDVVARLVVRARETRPERDLERVESLGGRLICPGDSDWPAALEVLDAVAAAPLALWVRGPASLAEATGAAVALVGARAATDYGTHIAAELAAGLADRCWCVVSGGAYGIDGAAHRAALATGGCTVAVLASGVDVAYPRGHEALFERIAAEGLLISEWPPGSAPHRVRFLARNRVIAALAEGTVVVEAGLRSGAASTAAYARDLNRHVMAVPGPVTSVLSAGCHRLIRAGAVLVTSVEEILELVARMGEFPEPVGPASPELPGGLITRRVLDAVPVRAPVELARIAVTGGVSVPEVLAGLGVLEVAGLVERVGSRWRRCGSPRDAPQPMLDLGG